jgi:hypothetical protein
MRFLPLVVLLAGCAPTVELTNYSEAVKQDVRDEAGSLPGKPCDPQAQETDDCSSVKTMLSEYGFLRGRLK